MVKVLSLDLGMPILSLPGSQWYQICIYWLINELIYRNPKPRNAALTQSRNMTLRLPEPQLSSPGHLFLQRTSPFLSAWVLVRKQTFCPSSISETHPPYFEFSLSQLRPPAPQTKSKRQFSNLRSWQKTKLVFSPLLSLSQVIVLRDPPGIFYFSPPFLFHFQSGLSLSLSDNSAWLLSNRPVQFLLVQAYNTKEYKEDWKCNYKTVSSAQAQFFRQQPPFQHSWKEKKITRALLSNVIIYSAWNVLQETLIRPHVW